MDLGWWKLTQEFEAGVSLYGFFNWLTTPSFGKMGKVDFSFVLSVARVTPSFRDSPNKPVSGVRKNIAWKIGVALYFWGVKDTRHLGDQVVHIMKSDHLMKKQVSLNTKPFRVFSGKHILVPVFNPLLVKFCWKQKKRVGFSMFWDDFPPNQRPTNVTGMLRLTVPTGFTVATAFDACEARGVAYLSRFMKIGSCNRMYTSVLYTLLSKKCLDIILICTCISRPHKIAIAKF